MVKASGRSRRCLRDAGERVYVATRFGEVAGGLARRLTIAPMIASRKLPARARGAEPARFADGLYRHRAASHLERAWNRDPKPLETLRKFQKQGNSGDWISTPEHDQNSLIDLMRGGWLDSVQVIYNILSRSRRRSFSSCERENVGVIVRVAFDESALTGKLTLETKFPEADFRNNYFAGDGWRERSRVEKLRKAIGAAEKDLARRFEFALAPMRFRR